MFVLVTQADGSARRFPWLTYVLAIGLFVAFSQLQGGEEFAEAARKDALDYLQENPYVEVDPFYESVIPVGYADALRAEYFEQRESQGLAEMSEFLIERGQHEFVDLLAYALAKIRMLPEWRYGVRDTKSPAINWFVHVAVHEKQFALMLGITMLLLLGMALEDGWGPLAFGGLVAAGVTTTAFTSLASNYVDAVGLPWFGTSGLVATLLGAHFVRSFGGSPRLLGAVPMPGWLVLPAWLAAEYVLVRGVTTSAQFVAEPLVAQASGFGLGALVALALAALKFEDRQLDREQETEELVSNPALERAMKAKESGRTEQAFELLRSELRRDPKNRDVALALWDVSVTVGKAPRVAEAMLSVIEADLQSNQTSQAVANWFAMTDQIENVSARPTVLVRMGEALLDEGHPEAALAVLCDAVDGSKPFTTALAQRVVRVARDLDPDLTRRAAEIALRDGQLAGPEREELARLSAQVVPAPAGATASSPPVAAEAEASTAAAPLDLSDAMQDALEVDDTAAPLSDARRGATEGQAQDEFAAIDPQAISLDDLQQDFSRDHGDLDQQQAWNDPGLISDLDQEDLDGDLEGDFADLDDDALAEAAMESGLLEAEPSETVTELSVPSAIPAAEETITEVELDPEVAGETTTVMDVAPALRPLRVRDAVPAALESKAIVIEVEGGNKTRLPYERMEAIAAAAISGLGPKPIVVIDIVLNWQAAAEPMKVVRLRSDGFDPGRLVTGAGSQLQAIQELIADLLQTTGATPLPHFNGATGSPFGVFASLEAYHAEVLGACEAAASEG